MEFDSTPDPSDDEVALVATPPRASLARRTKRPAQLMCSTAGSDPDTTAAVDIASTATMAFERFQAQLMTEPTCLAHFGGDLLLLSKSARHHAKTQATGALIIELLALVHYHTKTYMDSSDAPVSTASPDDGEEEKSAEPPSAAAALAPINSMAHFIRINQANYADIRETRQSARSMHGS